MKRMMTCLAALLLVLLCRCALAEPLGWGFVNATDVALRRGMGGPIVTRLPEDTCVWINRSAADGDGVIWYEIRAGLHRDNANYDYSGWMMAEFIDAGDDVWHDVTAIAGGRSGLIALRADGSTVTAGRPIVAMDGSGWVSPAGWADAFGPAMRVGIPTVGNAYFIVNEKGELISTAEIWRFADGMARADRLEAAETIISGVPFPEWSRGADVKAFRSMGLLNPDGDRPIEMYLGVMTDGSIRAEPAFLAEMLTGWTDIVDASLLRDYVLGLKKDGTVLMAVYGEDPGLDVSRWTGITAIGAGNDWCVGLRADGTLVFSGDHVFMNEGHVRR